LIGSLVGYKYTDYTGADRRGLFMKGYALHRIKHSKMLTNESEGKFIFEL
jgi:hypothetical protein